MKKIISILFLITIFSNAALADSAWTGITLVDRLVVKGSGDIEVHISDASAGKNPDGCSRNSPFILAFADNLQTKLKYTALQSAHSLEKPVKLRVGNCVDYGNGQNPEVLHVDQYH